MMTPVISGGPATQRYRERLPAPAAAGWVSCAWIHQVSADGPAYQHRRVPNGSVEIAYPVGEDSIEVIGPQRAPIVADLQPGTTVIGIRLHPGAAPAALGVAARDLVDQRVRLDDVWGGEPAGLTERISAAASPFEALAALERAVVRRPVGRRGTDPLTTAVLDLLRRRPAMPVGALPSALFVSPRQLRRRCIAAFGYGPKSLQRVLRFQAFLALSNGRRRTTMGLSQLARVTGYADQSHLTRECVVLTGLPPRRFLAETAQSCSTNHDHAASFATLRQRLLDEATSPATHH